MFQIYEADFETRIIRVFGNGLFAREAETAYLNGHGPMPHGRPQDLSLFGTTRVCFVLVPT